MELKKTQAPKGGPILPGVPPEILDPEFDEVAEHEVAFPTPQGSDYRTLEPQSGEPPLTLSAEEEAKSFHRPDELIRADVVDLLERHPEIEAAEVKVRMDHGEVILTGSVPEEKMKLLASEVVQLVPGVKKVSNQLKLLKH
ncbi:MAG: BON domain-containing protein [Pseudobdellovibrionaceae bacterium]